MRPTTDLYQTKIDDLLSSKRQQEIRDVVELIKKYNPTKIAVEVVTEKEKSLNDNYRDYINGNFELEINEVHQLGFRIAAELKHERMYAIDWMEKGAGTRGAGEVYEWAKTNQLELFKIIFTDSESISTSNDDRILLIIGSSHVQILYQFLEESRRFNLESAMKYLNN